MPEKVDLIKLFQDWEVKPPIFADSFIPREEVQFSTADRVGYPGPRARLPIPRNFSVERLDIVAEAQKQGIKKIVIAYPTDIEHLERSKKLSANQNKFYPDIHWAELSRLCTFGVAKNVVDGAKARGISIEFLPMVKLTLGASVVNTSIRFWTSTAPPQDAIYMLFDDIVAVGTTLAAMLSHLRAHSVPDDYLKCSSYPYEKAIALSEEKRKGIARLRAEHPDVAMRADIILDLIGVDGMEAMTQVHAESMGITSNPDPAVVEYRFKNLVKELRSTYCHPSFGAPGGYGPVGEPTASFVQKLSALGFAPQGKQ